MVNLPSALVSETDITTANISLVRGAKAKVQRFKVQMRVSVQLQRALNDTRR